MKSADIFINLIIAVVLIVGAYQFYFFPQRHHIISPKEIITSFDERIPFRPEWVWIYSFLYYPTILLLVFIIPTFKQFNYTVFSFIALLLMQLTFFFIFPVKTPNHWRSIRSDKSLSIRFLSLVHKYDSHTNCFPSMHVSVATLTAFHLVENTLYGFGPIAYSAFSFPLLIGLSALYTKQHYFIDIPAGVVLGGLAFELFRGIPFS